MQSKTTERLLSIVEQPVRGESTRRLAVVAGSRFAWMSLRRGPEDAKLGEMRSGTGFENRWFERTLLMRRDDEHRAVLSLAETETKREVFAANISTLGVNVAAALWLAIRRYANSPEAG